MRCELIATIPVRNLLGECILWDDRSRHVWWTDIHAGQLFRYHPETTELRQFDLPERLGSFGLIDRGPQLICAFESGFALFDPSDRSIEWLARPELGFIGTRFNDGRVDRRGRFWAGTMVESDARDADGHPTAGSLYRLAGSDCRRLLGGIQISNSLCFSPDGSNLYFADSPTGRILAYELDVETGDPGRSRVFAEVDNGVPDGSTVDAEGYLWNAHWGGGKVVRYAPSGSIDLELDLPTTQPTCVCLGGEDLDHLFVTTASVELEPASLASQPEAGNVLIYRTPLRGIEESRFKV
jgi:sugar lactone lactonase YvrE